MNPLGPGFVAWCPSLVAALASCLVCLWCLVGLVGSSVVSFLVRAAVRRAQNVLAADIVLLITTSTAWSIQNEARYEFLDGPGILPMDHDKKPVKSESGQVKEAKSIEPADEVRQRT